MAGIAPAWAVDPTPAQEQQAARHTEAEADLDARAAAFRVSDERAVVLAKLKRLHAAKKPKEVVALGSQYAWASDKQIDAQVAMANIDLIAAEVARDRAAWAAAHTKPKATKRGGVTIGMTMQDVLERGWGKPIHVNRTTTAAHVHEQWVYSGYQSYLYFEDGVLTAIQN